jgi:hypothetical protein
MTHHSVRDETKQHRYRQNVVWNPAGNEKTVKCGGFGAKKASTASER